MFDRIIKLIGEDKFKKIQNSKILLVGIGGVGSFVFESLIRSGFQNITIIDYDTVDITNINRQLVANLNTINNKKIEVAIEHAKIVNKNINLKALDLKLDKNNINSLDNDFDFIIDACDSLEAKIELVKFSKANNIKIISSMGMGNRLDPTKIKISTLNKTINDPLAKKMRYLLKKENITLDIPVVFSEEIPLKKDAVYSCITTTSVAGIYITSYIINKITKLY